MCTEGRCTRFHVRRFVKALAPGQKIVHFREASTLSAPSEARSSLSALYWESGVFAASLVEVVDDAVLSGRARTTKQARVDGVDFHTSSVCPKLGRVPTTYKQSAGAESLLIRRRALNESASVATAEHHYRPVSRSAPWWTCVLSASRS